MAIYSLKQRIFIVKYYYQSGNSTQNVLTEFPNQFITFDLPSEDEVQTFVKLFEEFGSVFTPNKEPKSEVAAGINNPNSLQVENLEVKIEPPTFETDAIITDSWKLAEIGKESVSDSSLEKSEIKNEHRNEKESANQNYSENNEDCDIIRDDSDSYKSYSGSANSEDDTENWRDPLTLEGQTTKGALRIKCDDCDKIFKRQMLYERHRRVHSNTCTICNKRVVNIKAHMQLHEGILPYECELCRQRFKFNDRLKRHMSTHSEIRPFKCETCQSCFKTKDRLREHVKIHMPMEERPKKCHLCEKRFLNNVELNRHIRSHTGEKPTLCNECGKGFRTLYQLNMHKRTHTGEKPHSCHICGKTFSRNAGLIIHQRLHTGERPYKCRYCDKSFTDSGGRKMHEHVHLDDRPYKCVLCNKAYNFGSSLRSHIKLNHPK